MCVTEKMKDTWSFFFIPPMQPAMEHWDRAAKTWKITLELLQQRHRKELREYNEEHAAYMQNKNIDAKKALIKKHDALYSLRQEIRDLACCVLRHHVSKYTYLVDRQKTAIREDDASVQLDAELIQIRHELEAEFDRLMKIRKEQGMSDHIQNMIDIAQKGLEITLSFS